MSADWHFLVLGTQLPIVARTLMPNNLSDLKGDQIYGLKGDQGWGGGGFELIHSCLVK